MSKDARSLVVDRLAASMRPVVTFLDERRLARARARPRSVGAVTWAADKLRRDGLFDEADTVVALGLVSFGANRDLLVAQAMNANDAGRYAEAGARWLRVREAHPDLPIGWCGVSANARMSDDIETATDTMREALRRFPDDVVVLSESARVADRRGDPLAALPLWTRLCSRADVEPEWLQAYITNLLLVRRFDDATAEIDRAIPLYPTYAGLLATRGLLLTATERWDEALAFWRDYKNRFPTDWAGWMNIGIVASARALATSDDQDDLGLAHIVDAPVEVERVEDAALRTLMLRFESLGVDCEFGTVQRRYGAEPLSLLRWSTVPAASLLAALDTRFAGMGDAKTTEMPVFRNEYILGDTRWGFKMHTFLPPSQHAYDVVFPKMCRRLGFLRDKLVADLETGEKIFVYKSTTARLDDMRHIHERMRRYGRARLIWVKLAGESGDADEPGGSAGEARRIDDGLFVGFIGRVGSIQGRWDIAFDDWISLCTQVDGLITKECP